MDAKEAKEYTKCIPDFLKLGDKPSFQLGYARGYLDAIEKAQGVVEALTKISLGCTHKNDCFSLEPNQGMCNCGLWDNLNLKEKALARWEAEA